ncbi:MAG TPA: SRPBCC domain-containing protein, partial [Candidatus Paceibacterota bacterium]
GTRWPMKATFTTVEENSKLAYAAKAWTEGDEVDTEIDQTAEMTLTEENGKTKMKLVAAIHKTGPKAGMAVEGMQYGYNQQFDKLTKFLAK